MQNGITHNRKTARIKRNSIHTLNLALGEFLVKQWANLSGEYTVIANFCHSKVHRTSERERSLWKRRWGGALNLTFFLFFPNPIKFSGRFKTPAKLAIFSFIHTDNMSVEWIKKRR